MNQIQKSMLSSLGFLLVAGAAGGVAYWTKASKQEQSAAKEKEGKALSVVADDVVRVQLTHLGKKVLAEKENAAWLIKEPVATTGDDAAFTALCSALSTLTYKTRLKAGDVEPAQVGLAQPETVVEAKTKDGKVVQVWLGKKSSFDESVYVQAGTDAAKEPVGLVAGYSVAAFQKSLLDLREKRMTTLNSSDLISLQVMQKTSTPDAVSFAATRVVKDGKKQFDDAWRLSSPVASPADRDEINKVIQGLTNARALSFVDEPNVDLGTYGLDSAAVVATFKTDKDEMQVLLSRVPNGTAQKYYAKVSNRAQVMEVAEAVFNSARRSLTALRDKRFLDVDRDAVKAMKLTLMGAPLVLEKKSAKDDEAVWMVTAPQAAKGVSWKVSSLLYTLCGLSAKNILVDDLPAPTPPDVLKQHGFDHPLKTFILEDGSGKELGQVLVGKLEGTRHHVMAKDGRFIGTVDVGALEEMAAKPDEFMEAPPADGGATP